MYRPTAESVEPRRLSCCLGCRFVHWQRARGASQRPLGCAEQVAWDGVRARVWRCVYVRTAPCVSWVCVQVFRSTVVDSCVIIVYPHMRLCLLYRLFADGMDASTPDSG